MSRLVSYGCLIFTWVLLSCSKSVQTTSHPAFYGQWQFTGSDFGPSHTTPSSDSVVILTLKSDNSYSVSLNGKTSIQGSFAIDSIQYYLTIKFLNIDQPYGTNTSGVSNGVHFLSFNTAQIGQLVLFQQNSTNTPGETLSLVSYPITPEATVNGFRRLN